jgi:hypothetical protein
MTTPDGKTLRECPVPISKDGFAWDAYLLGFLSGIVSFAAILAAAIGYIFP